MAKPRIPNTIENPDGTLSYIPARPPKFPDDMAWEVKPIVYREAPSGTFYHAQTPPEVVRLLESARLGRAKARVFYGCTDPLDPKLGLDWLEEHDVQGRIGRSMGPLKVPLMVASRAIGGAALLDHCIVRLRLDGLDAWRHPQYRQAPLEARPSGLPEFPWGVFISGVNHANFKTELARKRFMNFIAGGPAAAISAPREPSLSL